MKDVTIEIENVGPIRALSIPIPEGGGVVVLQSANGRGKSTALRAIEQLAGRTQKSDGLSVREGEIQGQIAGLGRSIKVGLTRRSAAGELEAEVLDAAVDPSVLVDPGIADPEAADVRRIAVLCRLADVPVDSTLFPPEIQAHIPERAKLAADLPEMASITRRWIQAQAKELEDAAVKAQAEVNAALDAMAGADLDGPSVEDVRKELDRKSTESALRRSEADAYIRAANIAAAAREGLGDPWNREQADELATMLDAYSSSVDVARDALATALRNEQECQAACEAWEVHGRSWKRAKAADAELRKLPNPSDLELETLFQSCRELTAALTSATRSDTARRSRARADVAKVRGDALSRDAIDLRALAERCDDTVAQAIGRVAPMGLTVDHGRLVLCNGGKKTLWANLSHGERWRIALECAMAAVGKGGLLPIRQEAWEGLDATNRQEIATLARERGVVVVTAEATSGELQAVVVEGTETP